MSDIDQVTKNNQNNTREGCSKRFNKCAQPLIYETESSDSSQSTLTTQEHLIITPDISTILKPRHRAPRADNKAGERCRLYRKRHNKDKINQLRREVRQLQRQEIAVNSLTDTDEQITKKKEEIILAILKSREHFNPHTQRQRRYYERHREEILKRKREKRLKNISPTVPATPAERNRKYREHKKQEINQRRRESGRQQIIQRIHTECDNTINSTQQFVKANSGEMNSSGNDIINAAQQQNKKYSEETQRDCVQATATFQASEGPAAGAMSSTESVYIKCEPGFVKLEPKDDEGRPPPPTAETPSVESVNVKIEVEIEPDHNAAVKAEPRDYEDHGESMNADTSDSDGDPLTDAPGPPEGSPHSSNGASSAEDLTGNTRDDALTQKGGASGQPQPEGRTPAEGSSTDKKPKKRDTNKMRYTCEVCHKPFRDLYKLRVHQRAHTGEKPFGCELCPSRFADATRLRRHIKTHTGERPFECHICPSRFSRKHHLDLHLRDHAGEKPYQCEICQVKFARNAHLQNHLRTHTGEKPYECYICQNRFADNSSLRQHFRIHTGEKPFECNVCHHKFAQKTYLRKHLRVHTGEKPYHCKVCQKRFTQKNDLNRHYITHTGDKLFECNICQSRFTQKSNLNTHLKIHEGLKPHECAVCQKRFAQKNDLSRHVTRVHAIIDPKAAEKLYERIITTVDVEPVEPQKDISNDKSPQKNK